MRCTSPTLPSAASPRRRRGLEAGKDVLSESPVALAASEAEALFAVADERGLVFHEAVKTAYALAFSRLTLLVKSGMIGSPVSVRATCTSQAFTSPAGSLIGWGPIACLPIFEMLGTDYTAASAASLMSRTDGTDVYTKVDFIYPGACASIEVGSGASPKASWSSRAPKAMCTCLPLVENRLLRGALRGLLQQ